jgi:hypothetical protein
MAIDFLCCAKSCAKRSCYGLGRRVTQRGYSKTRGLNEHLGDRSQDTDWTNKFRVSPDQIAKAAKESGFAELPVFALTAALVEQVATTPSRPIRPLRFLATTVTAFCTFLVSRIFHSVHTIWKSFETLAPHLGNMELF